MSLITTINQYKRNFSLGLVPSILTENEQVIYELIKNSANDVNSSTFREEITIEMCGYTKISGKLDYDAKTSDNRLVEVKPQNYSGKTKLSANGNFTDFTHKRLKKYKDDNCLMLVSGFDHGRLMYIIEFDYNSPIFYKQLEKCVKKKLPNGDIKGHYCRSANFGWNQIKDANNLVIKYISPDISDHKKIFSGPFYKWLTDR